MPRVAASGPVSTGEARRRLEGMGGTGSPEWLIREDAGQQVLLALYLRQVLGIRSPDELPHLRGIPPRVNDRAEEAQALLERQWREDALRPKPRRAPFAAGAAVVVRSGLFLGKHGKVVTDGGGASVTLDVVGLPGPASMPAMCLAAAG